MIRPYIYVSDTIKKLKKSWYVSVLKHDNEKYMNINLSLFREIDPKLESVYDYHLTFLYDSRNQFEILYAIYRQEEKTYHCYIDLKYIDNIRRKQILKKMIDE